MSVPSSELGPLPPPLLSQASVSSPPRTKGGDTLAIGLGAGWVPIKTTGEKALHSVYSVMSPIPTRGLAQFKAIVRICSTESLSVIMISNAVLLLALSLSYVPPRSHTPSFS